MGSFKVFLQLREGVFVHLVWILVIWEGMGGVLVFLNSRLGWEG